MFFKPIVIMKNFFTKIPSVLYRCFAVLFVFSFITILVNVIFNKAVYNYTSIIMLLAISIFAALFIFLGVFIEKGLERIQKFFPYILAISALLLLSVQIMLIPTLRFEPQFYLEAIYRGAIEWVENGTFTQYYSNTCYEDYFYIFPNNLGALTFLAVIFKLSSILGISDYFFVAAIVNAVMICGTMVFCSLICKRIWGVTPAVLVVAMFLLSPPFYFMAPVFYTDSLSMLFPAASVYLILCAVERKKRLTKLLLFTAAGFICALGALIKATVLITVIAFCIYLLLKGNFRVLLAYLSTSVLIIAICFGIFNSYFYSNHLSKIKAENMNTPVHYWLDLAFHGNGEYNSYIFSLSRDTADPNLRKELLRQDISKAIGELKFKGICSLFERKSAITFGDGTYALSDFLDDNPKKQTELHKHILYDGEHYSDYRFISTSVFLSLLLLMLFSINFHKKDLSALGFQSAVFGIMLFLLFWETNSRYITTYIPFIIICAANGAQKLGKKVTLILKSRAK